MLLGRGIFSVSGLLFEFSAGVDVSMADGVATSVPTVVVTEQLVETGEQFVTVALVVVCVDELLLVLLTLLSVDVCGVISGRVPQLLDVLESSCCCLVVTPEA